MSFDQTMQFLRTGYESGGGTEDPAYLGEVRHSPTPRGAEGMMGRRRRSLRKARVKKKPAVKVARRSPRLSAKQMRRLAQQKLVDDGCPESGCIWVYTVCFPCVPTAFMGRRRKKRRRGRRRKSRAQVTTQHYDPRCQGSVTCVNKKTPGGVIYPDCSCGPYTPGWIDLGEHYSTLD